VFLLGRWKNYDELEECLTFEELTAIINALREKEARENKFMAAIQGIDLDEESTSASGQRDLGDIKDVQGYSAAQEGFGVGFGLGYGELLE
jgi:hypothetical protein